MKKKIIISEIYIHIRGVVFFCLYLKNLSSHDFSLENRRILLFEEGGRKKDIFFPAHPI